jgi:hypothetical protein
MMPRDPLSDALRLSLLAHLAQVPAPRIDRTKLYVLPDLLAIAILATLGGAISLTEIAQVGRSRESGLKTFPTLPTGIASDESALFTTLSGNRHLTPISLACGFI